MKKYIVIQTDTNEVRFVSKLFDTEEWANKFIVAEAMTFYMEVMNNCNSSIEISDGNAWVVSGEEVYRWSVWPVTV